MTIGEALRGIRIVRYPKGSYPVIETAASELREVNPDLEIMVTHKNLAEEEGIFYVAVCDSGTVGRLKIKLPSHKPDRFVYFQLRKNGSGWLLSSHSYYLSSFTRYLIEHMIDQKIDPFERGMVITPAFDWQRISYDYFLTQEGRIQRGLNKASYVRELARLGFTHVEVNGLAFPMALETGPKGEIYPMFYTYCPALDQFVYSELNQGLYPHDYISANLANLKENAGLAIQYGLTPGLLCFEPRSVPDRFFDQYPMLRGARVDHPFRSFKPRYNLTIAHPRVRQHYAEMLQKLLREVPELGFICIWSNDSGAGFEHTKSLYVGRNGGAYLIREWKDDEEIARAAGENALRLLRLLRDAGRAINPDFRIVTRMEPFCGEHDTVWDGLGDGVEVETASLMAKGWYLPYAHPAYPDSTAINAGTIYQLDFKEEEKTLSEELENRGSRAHWCLAVGPHALFEPLLGIPYPTLTYKRLKLLHVNDAKNLAHLGGTSPPELVSYNINHEITRLFLFNPDLDIDRMVLNLAKKWAGECFCNDLINAWHLAEEAIIFFPIITPLYATHGFTWYRLWARPLVPDIEAIPAEQRRYYEDFMCTTPHNPNNVDLSRDVLFQLTTPILCRLNVERIDRHVWKPLDEAIQTLQTLQGEATQRLGEDNIIRDQWVRLRALRCWLMTQRNVAAWIAGVHGYMEAKKDTDGRKNRRLLKDAIRLEIKNTEDLAALFDSGVDFMAMIDRGETPLVYGTNLKDLPPRRMELMRAHIDDEPHIDPNYTEKRAAELIE